MKKVCPNCRHRFTPSPRVKNQKYCGRPECQKARKRKWQRRKRKTDPDYKENQAKAQKAWQGRRPHYPREYRLRNPASAEKNRIKQRERNRARRKLPKAAIVRVIEKMDSINPANADPISIRPGRYCIFPVVGREIAKTDSIIIEISNIRGSPRQVDFPRPMIEKRVLDSPDGVFGIRFPHEQPP